MKRNILLGTILLAGLWSARAVGVNSITTQVSSPWFCQAEHRLGICISNDVPLKSLTVPLVIRYGEYGDGSLTSVKLSFDQRLSGTALSDIRETNIYFTENGACLSGQPGGFGSPDFTDTLTHAVPGYPIGILFHCATLGADYLPAGLDDNHVPPSPYTAGSLIMTLTFDDLWSHIDIDTVCTDPSNHLLFVDASDQPIVPIVSIGLGPIDYFCFHHGDLDMDGIITALDLGREIDYLFAGGSIMTYAGCEGIVDGGDFNCDGFPDAIDLGAYIDHLFCGKQGPCDPLFECAPCPCGQQP